MAATGLEVFDKTLQTTNIWLDELMDEIGPPREVAWHVLGTVLRTIRDRLPPDLGAHLGAQLPMMIRGLYYDQYRPSIMPEEWRSFDDFLERIGAGVADTRPVNARDAAHAVFRLLSRQIEAGQIAKVREALPDSVRRSWEQVAAQDQTAPESRSTSVPESAGSER